MGAASACRSRGQHIIWVVKISNRTLVLMQHLLAMTLVQLRLNTRLDPLWGIVGWQVFGNILYLGRLGTHAWWGSDVFVLFILLVVHLLIVISLALVAAVAHVIAMHVKDDFVTVVIELVLAAAVFFFIVFKSVFVLVNVEGQIVVLVHYNV